MLPIRTSGQDQHSKKAMKLRCMPGIFHFVQSNVISKPDVTVTLFEVPLGHIVEKGENVASEEKSVIGFDQLF